MIEDVFEINTTIKKTYALILDNEKVLIIKDKFIKEWRFFSTSKEEDKRHSSRTNIKILKAFKYKIKDEGFSIYVKENNLLLEGRIFRLNVEPIKFKVSKCIDSMWVSLNELNTIIFDESSLKMVNEINKNIDKRYYKVYVCKKDIKNKLVSFKMEFCKFCTLLEAKVEFNKILNNEKYTFKDELNKVNFKEIPLVDVEKNTSIKRAYIDKKDLDNILNIFHPDWWIDDNIDVSHVKLGIRLGGIIEEYEEMIDNEDFNVSLLWKDLESVFKNAYDNGEITYKDWKKLEYKYRNNRNIRLFK